MTERQKYIMMKAKEQLDGLRSLLEDVMYRTDDLPNAEFNNLNNIYHDLCAIHDRLFRIGNDGRK